jgi:UDP-N-acetylglucosamine transferase subunit ALG13
LIFVTVGEQLPFDRLIKAVDDCALRVEGDFFAQIGRSSFQPQNICYKKFIDPLEFNRRFTEADVVIGHAGMGTIISAFELGTPVIIMPRQATLGEHRNDHQLATSKRFSHLKHVTVVADEVELQSALLALKKNKDLPSKTERHAPDQTLIDAIREFIQ